jgi:hypothetical protein
MSFQPGDKKPENSGRKPGTPNKRNQEIRDYAESKGVSPAFFLIDILCGERIDIAKEPIDKDDYKWAIDTLMPYMYAKRKPADADGDDKGDPITELVNAFKNRA